MGCKWGEMTDWNEELRGWIMEARDLTEEEGMRMGWLSSWRQVTVETALFFPDRQADTRGLTAECVNMKGVCGYETAAATPIRTRSYLLSSNGMVQLGRTY